MRLFVALDLDDCIGKRLKQFEDQLRGFAPGVRWVKEESFHITLKFIGQCSQEQSEESKVALAGIISPAIPLEIRGCGFFPHAAGPRVFWAGVRAGESLTHLTREIDSTMAGLGIPAERAPYHPHVTLARAGSGAPGSSPADHPDGRFHRLQEKLTSISEPDFGSIIAYEFFLYESRPSPKGSIYCKLQHFPLG